MIDLSSHSLTIGVRANEAGNWLSPILNRGRGAVFVDTGFLRGLFCDPMHDQYAPSAQAHFDSTGSSTNFYTTDLVMAEAMRQIAKESRIDRVTKDLWFNRCSRLLSHSSSEIYVCAPPRNIVMEARRELEQSRLIDDKLDLCDTLSALVMNYAKHRRVFSFDSHFDSIFGAQKEP